MTQDEDTNLRAAFERALSMLRAGDELACSEIIVNDVGTGAVMLVTGAGITFDVVASFKRVMGRMKTVRR